MDLDAGPNQMRIKYDGGREGGAGPGCFGTGPLAASACSEVPPCPPGTASRLFTFSPFFSKSDFALFTPFSRLPFSSPGLPLHSLSLHLPNCLGGGEEARGRRGGRQPILRSHWSKPAAAAFSLVGACRRSCLGRGD